MRHLEARRFENLKSARRVTHEAKRLSVSGAFSGCPALFRTSNLKRFTGRKAIDFRIKS